MQKVLVKALPFPSAKCSEIITIFGVFSCKYDYVTGIWIRIRLPLNTGAVGPKKKKR